MLGPLDEVERIAPETAAEMLVIAMPSLDAAPMRRIVEACERTGIPFRTVPRLDDLLEGRSLPGELKEVAIEDLLGRQPVTPDWKAIRGWLGGRSVLVTGAGGSIGSELCASARGTARAQIALLEIDELALTTTDARTAPRFPAARPACRCSAIAATRRSIRARAAPVRARGRLPCRRLQAGADAADAVARGDPQQRAGHRNGRAGKPAGGRRHVRADFHRQGGRSGQRARREQAPGGNGLPGAWPIRGDALRHRALRQRAGFGRQRRAAVPRADPQRRPGHGDRSGSDALLHDDPGGLPADPAGRRHRFAACGLHARHGRAGLDPRCWPSR